MQGARDYFFNCYNKYSVAVEKRTYKKFSGKVIKILITNYTSKINSTYTKLLYHILSKIPLL